MKQYITHSENETKNLAKKISKEIKGRVFALYGDLGVGKTTFVQGFAQGLGIKDKIISPTFVLIRQHLIPKTKKILYHVDLYRLENPEDTKHLGIEEIMENPDNIVLIEWAERVNNLLPKNTLKISIENIGENNRKITFHPGLNQ